MTPPRLPERQREALAWLERVGKSGPRLLRNEGFQQRTFDALVEKGLIDRDYVSRAVGGPFPVYRYRRR